MNGGRVAGAVIGVLILLILIILFILCHCGCLRCREPNDELCRYGNLLCFYRKPADKLFRCNCRTENSSDNELCVCCCLTCKLPAADEPGDKDDSSDELCHCCCLLLRSEPCTCNCLPFLVPKSKDAIELLRWTSETWYEKDHENWVKTRDQLQPGIVRIIGDVYGTENDWEITRDEDKQEKAIREFLFQQLSRDQSMLDLVKEILRKYATINDLKTKLFNEIDKLLNKKRSIDGADAVYNRDEDEVHVSFMTQLNEEKRPLTDKEKEFTRDVALSVEAIVDLFADMSDAELCERGIFNIKPTDEIADMFVKETLQTEVKQQNGNPVTQIEIQKVTDETRIEMGVVHRTVL
ncbi:uncharacterized protein LOC141907808 [Tubulanus polymorphus]|uniref:uncharacterized protein LOC141907808 n=1 Tax=Tubulanus polymorphus TaxID=672921 RepID=UPI003DA34EE5